MFLSSRTGRKGFTLVELLVTVSIIALLVAILLPALGRARRSALASASGSNVSAFGRAMAIEASAGADGQLVSRGFDWNRDGDVTQVGWVSDMVDAGVINPGKALDPASPHRINEKVVDYAGIKNSSEKARIGYWSTKTDADAATQAANALVGYGPNSASELEDIWDAGHNTNYATSWQLVRGDPIRSDRSSNAKVPEDGTGPVTIDELSLAPGGASTVPLLAESRAGSEGDAKLSNSISPATRCWAATHATTATTWQDALNLFTGDDSRSGGWAVESFNDGMNASDRRAGASNLPVHEYNDFWPHQLAKRSNVDLDLDGLGDFPQDIPVAGFCTVLFGDFSARRITDRGSAVSAAAGDGWIGAAPTLLEDGDFDDFEIRDFMDDELNGISTDVITPSYVGGGGAVE